MRRRLSDQTLKQEHLASLDRKLVYSMSGSRIPSLRQLKYIDTFLNPRERWIWRSASTVFIITLLFLSGRFAIKHFETIPGNGGSYTEGVVGVPKHINPLYSTINDVDADLAQLVYSSLFKRDNHGQISTDLVTSFTVSTDGKVYTLKIRDDANWHSGGKLKVDDVVFTFNSIKDSQYKSPLRASFNGVTVEKIDDRTLRFVLTDAYSGFLELLTFGIMPQELWYQIPPNAASLAELNIKPIGTGPYKFKSLAKDKSGNLKSYHLEVNKDYYGPRGHISDVQFKFYPSFEELSSAIIDNSVDGISYLPNSLYNQTADKTYLNYHKLNLPQTMAIFFNQKANPVLADLKVKQALALAINKQELVDQALSGNARVIDGPVLPDNQAYNPDQKKYGIDQSAAAKLLAEAGWQTLQITQAQLTQAEKDKASADAKVKQAADTVLALGEGKWLTKNGEFLKIRLTSVNSGDNGAVTDMIKGYWQAIGVKTDVELVEPSSIQGDVIRGRDFEALFYGQFLNADNDLYSFLHSSQATAQGLNLSNYANKDVDKILEDYRKSVDLPSRIEAYKKLQSIVANDLPQIYLYSPAYSYIQNKTVKNFNTTSIVAPSDRLADMAEWYVKTSRRFNW
ncbi:ABC transporter substrate-binding protein [Candidatus Falkowbacteria bacterium]|nr:ABC transporter substrate-binding protein [Candidatus Falkowbacteria bacterium]